MKIYAELQLPEPQTDEERAIYEHLCVEKERIWCACPSSNEDGLCPCLAAISYKIGGRIFLVFERREPGRVWYEAEEFIRPTLPPEPERPLTDYEKARKRRLDYIADKATRS